MGIRKTEKHTVAEDGKTPVKIDGYSVTCDRCPRWDKNKKKLKPAKATYEMIDLHDTTLALARAGWIAKCGFLPAGTISERTGKPSIKGVYTPHVCVCPNFSKGFAK